MDIHSLINLLVPTLWGAFGPIATAAITALVNSWTQAYVPRPVQLVLSSVMSAVMAGITGTDPATASAIAGTVGLMGQAFSQINPKVLLTSSLTAK